MADLRGVVHSGTGFDGALVERDREAFETAFGVPLYPGSLNIHLGEPVAFADYRRVTCSAGERMYLPAWLNGLPVVISHRYPLIPPARRRLLVFAGVRLRDALGLEDGATVLLTIDDGALAEVPARDRIALAWHEGGRWVEDRYLRTKTHLFGLIRKRRLRAG